MNNMDKFKKRLIKLSKHQLNAVVLGTGFGRLADIVEVYDTVFVLSDPEVNFKSRNVIYKENITSMLNAIDVTAIFVDMTHLPILESTTPLWHRWKSIILIEGDDPIGRDKSQSLYKNHYRCTDKHGVYHVWKIQL